MNGQSNKCNTQTNEHIFWFVFYYVFHKILSHGNVHHNFIHFFRFFFFCFLHLIWNKGYDKNNNNNSNSNNNNNQTTCLHWHIIRFMICNGWRKKKKKNHIGMNIKLNCLHTPPPHFMFLTRIPIQNCAVEFIMINFWVLARKRNYWME